MLVSSRYILQQVSRPLIAALAIGLLVLLAERMVRLLDITLGKKNSFSIVFEMLAYLVPHYLGLAIPVALFVGLLFGFNRLSRDSEIDAFLAAGIGLHQITRPVIILACILGVVSLTVFGWAQPHARYAYRAIVHTVKNVDVFYLAEEGVFMQAGSRTFILDNLERGTNRFERIFLFEDKGGSGSETITAKRGALIEGPTHTRPILELEGGERLHVEGWPQRMPGGTPPNHVTGRFQSAETLLGSETDKLFRPRGIDRRELSLPELYRHIENPPPQSSRTAVVAELHDRLVNIFTLPVLPFLAIPFALGRRRGMRSYRFAVAVAILVAYHEIIQQGSLMAERGRAPPILSIWVPYFLFVAFAGWRYYRACFTVPRDRMEPVMERLSDYLRPVVERLFRVQKRLSGAR